MNVKLACMSGCVGPEFRLPLDQCILCSDCCKKFIIAGPGGLLVFFTAWKQDIFGAYGQSYTFAQPALQTARWS